MEKGFEVQKTADFLEVFKVIAKSYVNVDRDIHFNERFWHSLLVGEKRDYIFEKYPQVLDSYREFSNIVIRGFDWENYIYKCILAELNERKAFAHKIVLRETIQNGYLRIDMDYHLKARKLK